MRVELADFEEIPIDELEGPWVAVDTETTGIHPWGKHGARAFAFSFCDGAGHVAYARAEVDPRSRKVSLLDSLRAPLSRVLGDRRRVKIMHNARFDLRMLAHSALAVSGPVHDTMVMAHVATCGAELSYGLKPLCKKLLGIDDDDQSDLRESVIQARREAKKMGWPRGEIEAEYWMGDPELCKRYAVIDAIRTQALFQLLRKEIAASKDMRQVYEREMKLFWVLWRMENKGVRVFPERITELQNEYRAEMEKWESVVRAEVGREDFNFRSRKQLAVELYEKRGHRAETTAKGNYKIDAEKLHALAVGGDKLAHAVAEWYVADGVRRKYLDVFDRLKTREKGGAWVLHPSIRQVGAVTGRMSCGEPNLLTVSSETTSKVLTDVKPRPRYAFGPRDGCVWLAPDYSQMEVVMFAFLSRDPLMTRLVLEGEDFHSGISQSLFGKRKDYAENAKSYRKRSKAIMFCKLYGGGVGKIASLIPCGFDEAADFVQRWEEGLPHAMEFMTRLIHQVRKDGKLKNPLGRTYSFPDPNMAYKAVNYLVQGTGSDILKNSLVRIDRMFRTGSRKGWNRCSILLPIHDEVVVEVPRELVTVELKKGLVECLQGDHETLGWPMKLPVTMKVIEKSWNVEREESIDEG